MQTGSPTFEPSGSSSDIAGGEPQGRAELESGADASAVPPAMPRTRQPSKLSRVGALLKRCAAWLFRATGKALRYRGQDDPDALPIGVWLIGVALASVFAVVAWPVLPAILLIPPMLTLAVALPLVQRAFRYIGERAGQRWWLGALEMSIVAAGVAGVGLMVFGSPLRRGLPIDTADHQLMMARSQLIWERLTHGRWSHFTLAWQGGDALTDLYGLTANLLPGLVHGLQPRGTTFTTSYTLSVLAVWWLRGVGAYYLTRRFCGPHIAALLALASLYEVGKDVWDGVWNAAIYWGMTHNTLALTFGLFATALQVDLTRKTSGPRMLACAVFTALAACTHALGMLYCVISTASLAIATIVAKRERAAAGWALFASVSGLGLSAFFTIPLSIGLTRIGFRVSAQGLDYDHFGKELLTAASPTSSFGAFIGFALIAGFALMLAEEIALLSSAITLLLFTLLCTTSFLVEVRLLEYFPSFLDSQPRRMLTVMKTASLPALAWALDVLWARLRTSGSLSLGRVLARSALLSLVVCVPVRLVTAGLDQTAEELRKQISARDNPHERSHTGPDYRTIFSWLSQKRAEDPSATPWRVIINFRSDASQWRHPTWGEGVWTGVPIVDRNQMSSNFLTMRPREFSVQGLHDWAIRYVLSDLPEPPLKGLTLAFSSGSLHLWEVPDYDGQFIVPPPGVSISKIQRDDERISFSVSGAPADGADIQLRAAWYFRWRAHMSDGRRLSVFGKPPRPDAKPKQDQLVVHAFNGDVSVDCDGTMPGYWLGVILGMGACTGLVLAARERRRNKLSELLNRGARRLSELGSRASARLSASWMRVLLLVGGLLIVVGGMIALYRRGTRYLLISPLESLGMRVSEFDPNTESYRSCKSEWWRGRYKCPLSKATLDGSLGVTSDHDDSGEWARHWPGTRIITPEAGTKLRLDFLRLRKQKKKLKISVSTGHFSAVISCAGMKVERDYAGEKQEVLPVTCPDSIRVDLESKDHNDTLLFRGELVE